MTAVMRPGSAGPEVARLQTALNASLLPSRNLHVNGQYDGATHAAVRAYQNQVWLEADGLAGACTQNALFGAEVHPAALHNVAFQRQPTPETCWAAATSMMTGRPINAIRLSTPLSLLTADGALVNGSEIGSDGRAQRSYGRLHGLHYHPSRCWTASALAQLVSSAPVMMGCLWDVGGFASGIGSSGHWVVLVGVRGTRNDSGRDTTFRIYDPNDGIFSMTYASMLRRTPLATYGLYTR